MRSFNGHSGLARRTFLGGLATGGVGMAVAQGAPPQPLAARLPDAMTRPGGADLP
ncbi:twin-arginine translocation signal domain-containing protein [Acidovorax sp. 94]|uniref:twin-arginine translocation signal domain-containing protein n=1 Tax=Acidovorax sp. 94 TaxID=2135633 RepID=UPI000EB0C95C|nr:twin-arginine translocation signal domain-containing protein [Acidovorax sp. 94]